jgi:hypothetical protein
MRASKTEWESLIAVCFLVFLMASDSRPWRSAPSSYGGDVAAAAEAFLGSLDDATRARAVFPFDGEERFDWHFIPRERKGLPLKDMTGEQRTAAHVLMQSVLSSQGYLKATGVMQLEGILGALTNSARRDPEDYYFQIFGTPGQDDPWGWRFEGHHISLNFTSATNEMTVATPAFMGSNPAEVRGGPFAGWRLLGAEEDRARTLLGMLSEAQRAKAIIADTAPRDIITGNDRHARLERFEGLPASEINDIQREALLYLIGEYVHNARPDIARARMEKIHEAGIDNLYFAWAGSVRRGEGHYYRVHGPTVLIEYDNTQGNANHVHSVWRDLEDDFGEDLLRKHYEESDHQQ